MSGDPVQEHAEAALMPAEGKIDADRQQQVLTLTDKRSPVRQPTVVCNYHMALHRAHILSCR